MSLLISTVRPASFGVADLRFAGHSQWHNPIATYLPAGCWSEPATRGAPGARKHANSSATGVNFGYDVSMVWVQRHEPERREGGLDVAAAGGCCCCCCCCLHSLGGFIGAVTSTAKPVAADERAAHAGLVPGTLEPRYNVYKEYWVSLLILSGMCISVLWPSANFAEEGLFVLALAFPGVQLLASFVAFILVALSKRPGKPHRYAHLGKLALRGFVGAFIGFFFMALIVTLL